MGKHYEEITPALAAWIGSQPLFFVATAPLSAAGHVNSSPKGLDWQYTPRPDLTHATIFRAVGPSALASALR